jgi:hypothetical protein
MSKYQKGKPIESLDELAAQTFILVDHGNFRKVYHVGWFSGWPLRTIINGIENHIYYTVTAKET